MKRQEAIRRVLVLRDTRAQVCESMGIPRQTLSDWLAEERAKAAVEETTPSETLEGPE